LTRDVLVLTTTGRRSGVPRSTPLYYVHRGAGTDDRYYVAASFAGRDAPPLWYLNLVANPEVSIRIGNARIGCRARVLESDEADAVWPLLDATYRPFARYRLRTDRVIPVIELAPASPLSDPSVVDASMASPPQPDPGGAGSVTSTSDEDTGVKPGEPGPPGQNRVGAARTEPRQVERLASRLGDARSGRVVLVSHCLLNENTRYLGGAGRPGCVPEVVQGCVDAELGMVQMPCPEQRVWGGVLKRHLLRAYGSPILKPRVLRGVVLPMALAYTRWRYRRLARTVADQVADYRRNGLEVAAVLAVDGSPSCGLERSLDRDGR
jgi:deazaflavin-dependent oxidoreductase (nitroreductase family)